MSAAPTRSGTTRSKAFITASMMSEPMHTVEWPTGMGGEQFTTEASGSLIFTGRK
jgi:hypothetical protein